jgi:hypothetical protein
MKMLENIIIFGKGHFDPIKSNTFEVFQSYLFALGLELKLIVNEKKVEISKKQKNLEV